MQYNDKSAVDLVVPALPGENSENAVTNTELVFYPGTKKLSGRRWKKRRRRRVAFEEAAKKMLRYFEDSEELEVGILELKEQLGISYEAGMSVRQIAQQAMIANGQQFFTLLKKEKRRSVLQV